MPASYTLVCVLGRQAGFHRRDIQAFTVRKHVQVTLKSNPIRTNRSLCSFFFQDICKHHSFVFFLFWILKVTLIKDIIPNCTVPSEMKGNR